MKMKEKIKQAFHMADGKKINVSAVISFLLTLLIFLTAMGMLAAYLGVF